MHCAFLCYHSIKMMQRRPTSTAKLPARRRSQPGSVLHVNALASENASSAPSIRARSLRAAANNVQSQRQLHNEAVDLDRRRLFQGDPQVLIESSSDEEMYHVQSDDLSPQHGRVALKSHKGIVSERINTDGSDDEDSVPPQRDEEPVVANRTKTIGQRRHEVKRDKASFPLAKDACERCVRLDVQCRRPPGQNCVDCFVSGTACDVDGISESSDGEESVAMFNEEVHIWTSSSPLSDAATSVRKHLCTSQRRWASLWNTSRRAAVCR